MDPVFAGTQGKVPKDLDDKRYCLDLGIVVLNEKGKLRPANAIYAEVMSRVLTDQIQAAMDDDISNLKWTDGQKVFISYILEEFQKFWRYNAYTFPLRINDNDSRLRAIIKEELESQQLSLDLTDSFMSRVEDVIARQYDEAAYSLLLFAYIQKVINGGGLVHS
jgi:hypothetical protein